MSEKLLVFEGNSSAIGNKRRYFAATKTPLKFARSYLEVSIVNLSQKS